MFNTFYLDKSHKSVTFVNMNSETPNFKCNCCGGCCYMAMPWTASDLKRFKGTQLLRGLKFYLAKNQNSTEKIWCISTYEVMEYNPKCPFLGDDKKCIIYDLRPNICRDWSNCASPERINGRINGSIFGCAEFYSHCKQCHLL